MKVITTTYSAQYGHTSGGFIEYTSQVGHQHAARQRLRILRARRAERDAAFFARSARRRCATTTSAFTLGGPVVIPQVYNGRNKTFFFTNFD